MKKHLITINLICTMLAIGCSTLKTKTHKKMETFDISTFEKKRVGENYTYSLPNGDNVRQVALNREDIGYTETIKKEFSPYSRYKEFFKNGNLKREGQSFYGFAVGIVREYDQNGNLINQTNYEEEFPFSIESLIVKIKNEFHVDIVNDNYNYKYNYVNVNRQFDPPVYEITFPPDLQSINSRVTIIRIDGVTGSVLSNDTINRK